MTVAAPDAIDLKPDQIADVLLGHARAGTDLLNLPDLRTTHPISA